MSGDDDQQPAEKSATVLADGLADVSLPLPDPAGEPNPDRRAQSAALILPAPIHRRTPT